MTVIKINIDKIDITVTEEMGQLGRTTTETFSCYDGEFKYELKHEDHVLPADWLRAMAYIAEQLTEKYKDITLNT